MSICELLNFPGQGPWMGNIYPVVFHATQSFSHPQGTQTSKSILLC